MNNKYTIIKQESIEELNGTGYILKHDKTGARVVVISNEDDNKVFQIGFRTPPKDDTGVPHILEPVSYTHLDVYKRQGKDRHENLGFGTIGFETLNHIVHHKDFEQVPKILETPYIKAEDSKKSYPPYKYEIEMLKQEQFDPQMKEKILEDNQK